MLGYTEADVIEMINILHDANLRLWELKVDDYPHYRDELLKTKTFLQALLRLDLWS